MPAAGDLYTPHLAVAGGDPSSAVRLTLLDPDDGTTTVAVWADDPTGTAWTGTDLRWIIPGEWRLFWAVTGPGAGTVTEVHYIDPAPDDTPAGFTFATTADLARYGQPLNPTSRRALIDASREIERLTKTAVYTLAADGRPTDPRLRTALCDATCELVAWWDETGTGTGARALFTSASIAGVSLGFGGQASANPQADRIGPRVWSILLNAGLIDAGGVGIYG